MALGHSLVADPFLDPDCRTACDVDTILVASSPGAAGALALVARVLAALVWSAVLTFAVIDFRGGSRRAAAMHGALAVAGAAGLVTAIRAPGAVLMVVEAAALLVLGTALVLGSVRLAWQRRDMARLAARLSASSDTRNLEAALDACSELRSSCATGSPRPSAGSGPTAPASTTTPQRA